MATKTKTKTDVVRPLDDRVVILPAEADEAFKGGVVIIPESSREKQSRGRVVAVGPGRSLDGGGRGEMQIERGDMVLYGKYAGTEIEVGDETLIIVRETDVLAQLVSAG